MKYTVFSHVFNACIAKHLRHQRCRSYFITLRHHQNVVHHRRHTICKLHSCILQLVFHCYYITLHICMLLIVLHCYYKVSQFEKFTEEETRPGYRFWQCLLKFQSWLCPVWYMTTVEQTTLIQHFWQIWNLDSFGIWLVRYITRTATSV